MANNSPKKWLCRLLQKCHQLLGGLLPKMAANGLVMGQKMAMKRRGKDALSPKNSPCSHQLPNLPLWKSTILTTKDYAHATRPSKPDARVMLAKDGTNVGTLQQGTTAKSLSILLAHGRPFLPLQKCPMLSILLPSNPKKYIFLYSHKNGHSLAMKILWNGPNMASSHQKMTTLFFLEKSFLLAKRDLLTPLNSLPSCSLLRSAMEKATLFFLQRKWAPFMKSNSFSRQWLLLFFFAIEQRLHLWNDNYDSM